LGIPVKIVATGAEYLEIIKRPEHGRGSGMNPCLDCRIFMFSRAREYMAERAADFVATGEVLGERPMSQRRRAMELIERESGLAGFIVRPLSGKLMPESLPERKGLVRREKLMAIRGRSRKPQFELAQALAIKDYLCPAGGCLLTDAEFSARLRDLLEHNPDFTSADARLLSLGRHFRLPSGAKVVVGRNEGENARVESSAGTDDVLLVPRTVPGPSVLCRRPARNEDIGAAAGLLAYHTKKARSLDVEVRGYSSGKGERVLEDVQAVDADVVRRWRIGLEQKRPLVEERTNS
jgi:hypothetical protein